MKLTRIGFSNFRSIGEEPVWLDLTKKANVLIGPNNSGKSNVFRALQFARGEKKTHKVPNEIDRHMRKKDCDVGCYFHIEVEDADEVLRGHFKELTVGITLVSGTEAVLENPFLQMGYRQFNPIYTEYEGRYFSGVPSEPALLKATEAAVRGLANKIFSLIPDVHIIPDIRKIDAGAEYGFDGRGIIATLASWQIPKLGNEALEEKYHKLNVLLQKLLRTPNVNLEVPPERDVIIVRRDGLRLPLASYGTGIHELIILAIAVFSQEEDLFCIEEPEIHLHPLLQKEFLRFLIDETNNRYVLSTHSQSFMNLNEDSNVVRLWQKNGVTKSQTVENTAHSLDVLNDLGINAGDLLQARSVIWVEGPSDRIYLNHWLSLLAPELREGIDYSIMFYGGRLLSHLSLGRDENPEPTELIPLLRINQHSAIIIDSDRSRSGDSLNATKTRIQEECEESSIPCWITEGREIENYLPKEVVASAYAEITEQPVAVSFGSYARLESCLKKAYGTSWRAKWSYDSAKVKMAYRIVPHFNAEHITDNLRKQMGLLIAVIQGA